ncbi:MAG TPA: capsular biosynthesis protein [Nitrospirae bacterium]|nr:tyrosine-protein phosphatase YwqE [bacterium BMS3Bbin05]HDO35450.1 capsular biosynthesis protein [Nitrospirota bacterium]
MNNFIDIHCHILPGLDDGAGDIGESVEMLKIAEDDGISVVVATPHMGGGIYDTRIDDISRAAGMLRQRTGTPELLIGADVMISPGLIDNLKNGKVPLINNGRYLLLEFPVFSIPPVDYLSNLFDGLEYINVSPVITHPERNAIFSRNMSLLRHLVDAGASVQVTAMSVTGGFGRTVKRVTKELFKRGLVHAVATDAHNTKRRPPVLSKAYLKVKKDFGEDTAERVFITNPRKILNGDDIDT